MPENEQGVLGQEATPQEAASVQSMESRVAETQSQVSGPGERVAFNPASEGGASGSSVADNRSQQYSGVASLPSQQASQAQQQQAQQDQWESLQDAARGLGYQFPDGIADDRAALLHILNDARRNQEADYYAQLGRQLAPRAAEIQQALAAQRQQASAPAGPQPWEAPPFDTRWAPLLDRDPATGVIIGKPGVPQEIVEAANRHFEWKQKFDANPMGAVQPYIEKTIPELIRKEISDGLNAYRREQTVNTIVARNAEWMYQQSPQGRPVIGVGGQMVPTPQGMRYGQLVQQLERSGMSDPSTVDSLARQLLMGELAMGQLQSSQGNPSPNEQADALASGGAQRNVLQSQLAQTGQQAAGATSQNSEGMSLHEMLMRDLTAAGYTDSDFADPSKFMS